MLWQMETVVDGAGAEVTVTGMATGVDTAVHEVEEVAMKMRAPVIGVTWSDLNCPHVKTGGATIGRQGRSGPDAKNVPIRRNSSRRLKRCWPKYRTGSPSQHLCRWTPALPMM